MRAGWRNGSVVETSFIYCVTIRMWALSRVLYLTQLMWQTKATRYMGMKTTDYWENMSSVFREKLFLNDGDRMKRRPESFSCLYVHTTGICTCLHITCMKIMSYTIKNNHKDNDMKIIHNTYIINLKIHRSHQFLLGVFRVLLLWFFILKMLFLLY